MLSTNQNFHYSLKDSSSVIDTHSCGSRLPFTTTSSSHNMSRTNQRRQEEQFMMFIKVLMKYLRAKDPKKLSKAKEVIQECVQKHDDNEPGYLCLMTVIQTHVIDVIGKSAWKKAERRFVECFSELTRTVKRSPPPGAVLAEKKKRKMQRSPKRVKFDKIIIREYAVTIGDNPSCSTGAPISLDWKYNAEQELTLNEYEEYVDGYSQAKRISIEDRHKMLLEYGVSQSEIMGAAEDCRLIQEQRFQTIEELRRR
jgi:hypothetical protein